jgi:16S rRNA G527 N7-methylase RsmG
MAVLAELGLPLLRLGGQLLLYKGPRGKEEASAAINAITKCGGKMENVALLFAVRREQIDSINY